MSLVSGEVDIYSERAEPGFSLKHAFSTVPSQATPDKMMEMGLPCPSRLTDPPSLDLPRRFALARPDRAFEDNQTAGRDVGLAESGFAIVAR